MKRKFSVCLVAIMTMVFGGSAMAMDLTPDPTPDCQTSYLTRHYNAGYMSGKSLVTAAWKAESVGGDYDHLTKEYLIGDFDPTKLEEFTSLVIETFIARLSPTTSAAFQCRQAAMVEAAFDVILHLQMMVIGQCVLDGGFVGEFSAQLYCDFAGDLDGLGLAEWFDREDNCLCGDHFEAVCDDVFAYVATDGDDPISWFVETTLNNKGFFPINYFDLTGIACKPYTQCSNKAAYLQAMNNMCMF